MQRKCVITLTPDDERNKADIQTGGVSNIEILDYFKGLSEHFAKELVKEYQELTGDIAVNNEKFEEWVKFLRDSKL